MVVLYVGRCQHCPKSSVRFRDTVVIADVVNQLSRVHIIPIFVYQTVRAVSFLNFRDKLLPVFCETSAAALPHNLWAAPVFQIVLDLLFCHFASALSTEGSFRILTQETKTDPFDRSKNFHPLIKD